MHCIHSTPQPPNQLALQIHQKYLARINFTMRYMKVTLKIVCVIEMKTYLVTRYGPWSHKPALLNGRFGNCNVGGCKKTCLPFANPLLTLREPFLPTLYQPLLPTPLQAPLSVDPGTRLETRVSGFLDQVWPFSSAKEIPPKCPFGISRMNFPEFRGSVFS